MSTLIKKFFISSKAFLKTFSSKKSLFAFSFAILFLYSALIVFAIPPASPYAVGDNITDPACPPNSLNCYVTSSSGVGIGDLVSNGTPSSILYLDGTGNLTQDSLFTRDVNHDTYIGRTYQNTLPGDLTLTLDPLIAEFSTDQTPAAFVPGEQLTFEDTNTNTTYTGMYSEFMYSINQSDVDVNTTFNGNGINDLNASANSDYSGPVPTTFTITIIEKNLSIYGMPANYNGDFQIGETVVGSNSGATGVVVSTVHGLVLDNITGTFQQFETITGNTSGATVNNDVNGNTVDVFSYDNGDVSGIGIAGYGSIEIYGNSLYFNVNNSTGHEIGDQWIIDVTSTPFYIHIHKVSNINTSVQENQLSVTGQTSNISIQAGLFAITPLGAPGDQIIFLNYSGPTPTIDGIGAITVVNGSNYGIQIQQGTYHVGDLAFIDNLNGRSLTLVSAANTDPITVDMSSGFSINSNILGAGLRGSVFQQTDGTVTGVMGAIDASSVGGQAVTLGSNISSTATNATSFTSQTIDEIIQTVEMNSGDKSVLSLTGSQFKLSTTYTDNPNPALESGFMSTFNQSTTLVPAWFVGDNIQKLPSDLGSSGYVLTTDGAGNLSWAASSGGSSPISINGTTLYSSGLNGTGNVSGYNIFLGDYAGDGATSASNSNFLGYSAGQNATSAYNSNFLGQSAGNGATNAYQSNFLGSNAGYSATGASYSNFLGYSAGQNATSAYNSNFLGQSAGNGATSASYSNFLGQSAGNGATSASFSNFLGPNAGINATGASYSNFLGQFAGKSATNAYQSNFLGYSAGNNATNAYNSNFLGNAAGNGATGASNSNFLGLNAGNGATGAYESNFLGYSAGSGATSAYESNFLGYSAGNGATNAYQSNFLGYSAGYNATYASNSNFFGNAAGYGATGASNSNFLGLSAGNGATNASYSNFLGLSAGINATNASNSNFLGLNAGNGATGAYESNFLGRGAGVNATDAYNSNFLGLNAGNGATNAYESNFLGLDAGRNATGASYSNFLGQFAGKSAAGASDSNFFGYNAGYGATSAQRSNFLGYNSGNGASGAFQSNFFGYEAGLTASSAGTSNFIGYLAGRLATNAANSNFIGNGAGSGATNAANSIFIGKFAGYNDLVNNTGNSSDFSILIGPNTSTGNNGSGVGYSNSIALGGYATNTASNQFMIGSTTRTIDTTVWKGAASTTCTLTTGTGMACSSDERLKTNIENLTTDTLDRLLNVKTVTYNWLQNPTSATQIGFLAQDLEQYFPELVATDNEGMKSVYYSQITPVLVEAIREMNMKVVDLNDLTKENTWRDAMISWLGNASNKITRIFTGELCLYDENGQTECINASQLRELKQNLNTSSPSTPPVVPPTTPDSTPLTCTTPQILNQAGDACIDPVTDTPPSDTGDQTQDNPSDVTPTE